MLIDTLLFGNLAIINMSLASADTVSLDLSTLICILILLPLPLMGVCAICPYFYKWWKRHQKKKRDLLVEEDNFEELVRRAGNYENFDSCKQEDSY